jgi:hypothetical protein
VTTSLDHLQTVDQQPGFVAARYRSLIVFGFGRDVTEADLRLVGHHQESVLRDRGRCTAISVLARFPTLRVEPSVREASVELARRFDGRLVGVAFVSLETGLRARIMRRILPGIFTLARSGTAHAVFEEADEIARWIADLDGQEAGLIERAAALAKELPSVGNAAVQSVAPD